MKKNQQKQPLASKSTKKIADPGQVRFGAGSAPAKMVRAADVATSDSGAIRFGAGSAPAKLIRAADATTADSGTIRFGAGSAPASLKK